MIEPRLNRIKAQNDFQKTQGQMKLQAYGLERSSYTSRLLS
jgi:hypothetical protein